MNPAMNPAWGHLIGVVIVLLMLIFIGIWVWAWLPYHKKTFDNLARLPMHDPTQHSPQELTYQAGHAPVPSNAAVAAARAAEIEDKAP